MTERSLLITIFELIALRVGCALRPTLQNAWQMTL
jgi:hypothetical protein